MYLQGHLSAIWLRLLTESDVSKRQAAQELVELVARAVFVDEMQQNWHGANLLPVVSFHLAGRDYSAVSLGKDVDSGAIEYLNYDYNGIELFLLRPNNPDKEYAVIAAERTYRSFTDRLALDLSCLPTSFLQDIYARIMDRVPVPYQREYDELRKQMQREVAARGRMS